MRFGGRFSKFCQTIHVSRTSIQTYSRTADVLPDTLPDVLPHILPDVLADVRIKTEISKRL